MYLKFAYFIKLFLIVTLSAVFLAVVGAVPDQPVLSLAVSAACVFLIRFLWKSVQKEEEMPRRRRKIRPAEKDRRDPPEWKQPEQAA